MQPEVPMNAEAVNPATPGRATAGHDTPAGPRRKARPRLDLRRLGRAALLGPAARDRLPDAIGHVVEAHRAHHPDADLEPLRRAYLLAESSHRGQMRKSGEPYITHPLAVTLILAELGAETTTLTASLLHDTVEDTEVTLDQVHEEFGEEVSYLVDGVTKLEKVDYGAAAEPETFRKMLVATGNDVRVMSIKLADRLHNMRTLGVMRPAKQERIAKVTRDVLIPLAERLGVQALKTELEDLAFAILHPEEYEHTRELILRNADRDDDPLAEVADDVRTVLREADITAEVLIRPRHFLSVHRVSRKRGQLRGADFGRVLVLVGGRAARTRRGWLSRLLDWQRAAPDPETFWSPLREDLSQDREITVFRPDGGTLGLPEGASCVDAAYAQYGEDAHACIGARVNGRLATLSTVLKDGDTVQLLMGQDPASEPSREWLDHAHTPAARIAIQRWLTAHPAQDETTGTPAVPSRPAADGPAPAPASRAVPDRPAASHAQVLADRPGAAVRLARCCTPVPPDEVTGFAVRGGVVTVHRAGCAAVARMKAAGREEV